MKRQSLIGLDSAKNTLTIIISRPYICKRTPPHFLRGFLFHL